ncbi:MAG: methionyl-tRNA formyltransferase, partial [Ktedonobacterales bacterium]|nr:methionyl-tRNA formyltransferase [Ktedonobacterales bacterium]
MAEPEAGPARPSLRVVYLTMQPAPVVNAIIETCERLGHHVPLVVTAPSRTPGREDAAGAFVTHLRPTVDALVLRHPRPLLGYLRGVEPDLLLVAGFRWRLPAEVLALPRLGCVNAHPSLLPRYRGPNPLYWQVANGETEIGLTLHRMDADFDTGAILAQRTLPLAPDDDIDSLFPKLHAAG